GIAAAQRISSRLLDEATRDEGQGASDDPHPLTYDDLTDAGRFTQTHDPEGEIFQLIGVGVTPEGRGLRLGRVLVDREIALARSLPGVRRIAGFTRPVLFHRHPEMDIAEYVTLRNSSGVPLDPVLAFHLAAGASIVSTHAGFRP